MTSVGLTTSMRKGSVDITARLHELVYDLSGVSLSTLSLSPGTPGPNTTLRNALNAAAAVASRANLILGRLQQMRNSMEALVYCLPDEVLRQIIREADCQSENYNLRLVSARWRDVVDCMSEYWATIRFSRMKKEFKMLCLDRSSSWPLDVELLHPIPSDEPSLVHAHRWKSLILMTSSIQLSDPLVPCPLPALEKLHLKGLHTLLDCPSNIELIDNIPQLTNIHLNNVYAPTIRDTTLARLRSLSLTYGYLCEASELLDLLRPCKRLQQLTLTLSNRMQNLPPPLSTIGLPHLTKVVVDSDTSWLPILDHLAIPDSASMVVEVPAEDLAKSPASIAVLVNRLRKKASDFSLWVEVELSFVREQYVFRNSTGGTVLELRLRYPRDTDSTESMIEMLLDGLDVAPLKHVTVGSETCTRALSESHAGMLSNSHPEIGSVEVYNDGTYESFRYLYAGREWIFPHLTAIRLIHTGDDDDDIGDLFDVVCERAMGAAAGHIEQLQEVTVIGMTYQCWDEEKLKQMVPNVHLG